MSHQDPESTSLPPLLVSTLDVYLKPQSRKKLEAVIVSVGNTAPRQIRKTISPGGHHQELFHPPLQVLPDAKLCVSLRYNGAFRRAVPISLNPQTVLFEAQEKDGKQVYCKTKRNVEITIGIQSLPSNVNEIVASCSRFRVLVIGKAGVGKSSLITKVFGVDLSDTTREKASIDQEYITPDHDRFIVHRSAGFEAGDRSNWDTVRDFITRRRGMRDLKDQLHAVWLCLEIPFHGGRILEIGIEDFLRDQEQILGNIPLIAVFTKLDALVDMLSAEALRAGNLPDDDALSERKRESLERLCLTPLRTATGKDSVPHVAVSDQEGYEDSLDELVQETTKNINRYINDEAAHYIPAAQQRRISLKVAATIAVVKKRYCSAAPLNFRGHTVNAHLDALHKDIVTIWSFKDPQLNLLGEQFKGWLVKRPDNVKGTQDLRQVAQGVIRQLMAYIVDLTCVLQILLVLTAAQRGQVSVEALGIAMRAYEETHRLAVHIDINAFPVGFTSGRRGKALEKVRALIEKHRIPNEDIVKLGHRL